LAQTHSGSFQSGWDLPRDDDRAPFCEKSVGRILAMPHHVSKPHFYELVERALAGLPEEFAEFLEEVPVEVMDRATPAFRKSRGLEGNGMLLGLYRGRPRTERSVEDSGLMPDVIYIFQRELELISRSEEQLVEEVRKTVLHEIGHHFGLNEDDLEKLGYR
jgi:predicted Zn-dependent protease with MMP-like domain